MTRSTSDRDAINREVLGQEQFGRTFGQSFQLTVRLAAAGLAWSSFSAADGYFGLAVRLTWRMAADLCSDRLAPGSLEPGPAGPDVLAPGSKEAFDHLYRATYQRIFRTLVSITRDPAAAEDCAQEAFLRAFRAWRTWKGDAPAEAWLHRIAINTAISHRRRERIREVGALIRRLGV